MCKYLCEVQYVICALTSGDYETTYSAVECPQNVVEIVMIWRHKQFIIHTSYTAPPQPECIMRETRYMKWMWAVWERRYRIFFHFVSNSSSSEIQTGKGWEVGTSEWSCRFGRVISTDGQKGCM